MSNRNLNIGSDALSQLLRDYEDRLIRLEQGGALAGRVSFGPEIQIGDVTIRITKGVGTHRTVHFINVLSGVESTIVL